MNLQYLTHNTIDRQAWDACVAESPIPMIYGTTAFLDVTAPNWDGIVADNYRTVMPVPHRKKMGIRYAFRPVLTQQLGVFGKQADHVETVQQFIDFLSLHFRFAEIPLNTKNPATGPIYGTGVTHYLALDESFETISKSFTINHRRNISKAQKAGYIFAEHMQFDDLQTIVAESPEEWIKAIDKSYAHEMLMAIEILINRKVARLFAINNQQGVPVAMALFSEYNNQLNYLFGISNHEGKQNRAMFLMFSSIIEMYAGTGKQLDFEGSETESIARFFRGFGGQAANYAKIRINRLPAVVGFLKNKKK
ncbi:MAG TPA: hypothetical protein PLA77_05270 [Bacteroidales bacterium]|nr:hypothetical protein [Bacteroidales bacterium]